MSISLAWCLLFFKVPVLPTDDAIMSCSRGTFHNTKHETLFRVLVSSCFIIIPIVIILITNTIILIKVR